MSLIAFRLRVDMTSLHMSTDEDAPYPTIDVLAAVIREYGVDPGWLLTGYYDSATHRTALSTSTDEMPAIVSTLLGRMASGGNPPVH